MLVVEDGTGIETANSYADILFAQSYLLGERLALFNDLSDDQKEAALIHGSFFVDNAYIFRGNRASAEQGLNFPRTDLIVENFEITGIPAAIKRAAVEAAFLYASGESFFSTEADKTVASEKVDVIAVSYFDPKDRIKTNQTRFEVLNMLLRKYIREEEKKGGSSIGSANVIRS